MRNMFITSKNKNPVINFERNQLKNQKLQKSIGSKISPKMHEKGLTGTWRQKPWEKLGKKRQKLTWSESVEEEKRESFLKKCEQCDEHVRKDFFKKLSDWFLIGQKLDLIDQKSISIDLAPIEPGRL